MPFGKMNEKKVETHNGIHVYNLVFGWSTKVAVIKISIADELVDGNGGKAKNTQRDSGAVRIKQQIRVYSVFPSELLLHFSHHQVNCD